MAEPPAPMPKPPIPDQDLDWLSQALFGRENGPDRGGFRFDPRGGWLALPLQGPVRRLVPVEHPGFGAAFSGRNDAMGRARLAGGTLARLGGAPVARALTRRRVAVEPNLDLGGNDSGSLLARLGDSIAGVEAIAITLGPRRYNRKPVVQLIGERSTIGFAKVAADPVTARLVANETRWVRAAHAALGDTGRVRVPAVVDSFTWRDHPVLVLAAAAAGPAPAPDQVVPVAELVQAIARIAVPVEAAVALPADRIAGLAAGAPGAGVDPDRLDRILAELADPAVMAAATGTWHGDLTPWNTISHPDSTWVLDWELAGAGVPIGADLLHREMMVATHLRDQPIRAALAAVAATAERLLAPLGADTDSRSIAVGYLGELVYRDLFLASIGAPVTGFGTVAADLLTKRPAR